MDNAKSDKGNRGRKGVQTSKPRLSQIFWSRYKIEQESRTQPTEPNPGALTQSAIQIQVQALTQTQTQAQTLPTPESPSISRTIAGNMLYY